MWKVLVKRWNCLERLIYKLIRVSRGSYIIQTTCNGCCLCKGYFSPNTNGPWGAFHAGFLSPAARMNLLWERTKFYIYSMFLVKYRDRHFIARLRSIDLNSELQEDSV
jgi:hypothetical protein